MKKGFTLFETLIYMAVSTLLCSALLGLAFTFSLSQKELEQTTETQMSGLYWLRAFDSAVHNHALQSFSLAIHSQAFIENIVIATSTTSATSSLDFTIDHHHFYTTIYEK